MTRRNMVKSYLIAGKSLSSDPQYRGTALRAISRFGESRPSYCKWSMIALLVLRQAIFVDKARSVVATWEIWKEEKWSCLEFSVPQNWTGFIRPLLCTYRLNWHSQYKITNESNIRPCLKTVTRISYILLLTEESWSLSSSPGQNI